MPHKYAQLFFTDSVRKLQTEKGSRASYQRMDSGDDYNHILSPREAEFINERDSVYMASVSENGWPYVQHRGGPPGFLKVLDAHTLGFSDYSGNRQYVSSGNFRRNNRVSLFFMDYPNQRRLKLAGRIETVAEDDWRTLARMEDDDYPARVERAFLIHIEAFDWNCPQHITPRYTEQQLERLLAPLQEENRRLRANQASAYPKLLGSGSLTLVISGIRQLTPAICAYELRAPDGHLLPEFSAGAHLAIPVQHSDGQQTLKHYSICSNPQRRDRYEIAVQQEPNGQGGSTSIHRHFTVGLRLACEPPINTFRLHDDTRPAVLIAGGIGITPLKAMAHELANSNRPFELHYAGRSLLNMAFQERLKHQFPDQVSCYPADSGPRLSLGDIFKSAPNNAVFYLCGPQRLLDAALSEAEHQGIDKNALRYEKFQTSPLQNAQPFEVTLARSHKTIAVNEQESVLDALLANGCDIAYSCKTGACKTCVTRVLDGEVEHHDQCLSESERNEQRLMCPCVSRAASAQITLDV